jgi:hypothetical protein
MERKKLLIPVVLIVVVAVTAVVVVVFFPELFQGGPGQGFTRFENHTFGISFDYPSEWIVQVEDIYLRDEVYIFLLPQEGLEGEGFQVTITVTDMSDHPISFEDFTEAFLEQYSTMNTSAMGIEIIDSSPTTLSGLNAHRFVITMTQAEYTIKQMRIWTIRDSTKGYNILYYSTEDLYDTYLAGVQEVINTFRVY